MLEQVSLASRGRAVHCVYVNVSDRRRESEHEDTRVIEFLQNLATLTKGSFKIVTVGRYGVERITPIYCFDPTLFAASVLPLCCQPMCNLTNTGVTNFVYSSSQADHHSDITPRVLLTSDGKKYFFAFLNARKKSASGGAL